MFDKRYSPTVLSKAVALAYSLATIACRYVLQDEMLRIYHCTLDDKKWTSPNTHSGGEFVHYTSEIAGEILCRDGKFVTFEITITLLKRSDGEWVLCCGGDSYQIRFPKCKDLKTTLISFRLENSDGGTKPEDIKSFNTWIPNISSDSGDSCDG